MQDFVVVKHAEQAAHHWRGRLALHCLAEPIVNHNPEAKLDATMFAEQYQFYVCDGESDPGELSIYWPQEARARMLLITDTILGIATVRCIEVPVEVEIKDERPVDEPLDDYDQVIECQISIPSGTLAVSSPTEDFCETVRMEIPAGLYGVRVYWGALDEVDVEGFEGEDFYRVALWKTDKPVETKLLKQWQRQTGSAATG